ncbi:MAG: Tim44/TimA family putative adaptor protein [Alphaproteobacteria bacterium]|nr:Tim44/TimA family putative adaptor protein [Alphaproteobacteria bacterium]
MKPAAQVRQAKMDGGLPYGDIIVIGAIAAFILLRYRSMLGEQRGRDEPQQPSAAPVSTRERVVQLPLLRAAAPLAEKPADFSNHRAPLAEQFIAMRAVDHAFSPDEFLQGARAAYEMVIGAFSKRDRETLNMLLSPEMYKSFTLSLDDAQREKRFNDTTLVAINKAEIVAAKLAGTQATLTVDFVSEQIHLIRDEAGGILEGDPSQQVKVEDSWVFTRNLSSASPNWVIIET